MAQYALYRREDAKGFLLDVQSDLLSGLNVRTVVPLLPEGAAPKPAKRLNPVFALGAARFVMVTQFLSAVPANALGEAVGSLEAERDQITQAVDMLFHGF